MTNYQLNSKGSIADMVMDYCKLSGVDGVSREDITTSPTDHSEVIHKALEYFGLIESQEQITELKDMNDVVRGGNETYISDGELTTDKGTKHFIAKHIVSTADKTDAKIRDMLSSRAQMTGQGFDAPELFGASNSMIVEEHMAYDFDEAMKQLPEEQKITAIHNLVKICAQLDALGINFDPHGQIRADENGRVAIIDFGTDLSVKPDTTPDFKGAGYQALKKFSALLGDEEAHAKAQTMTEASAAKNAFNPIYDIEKTYEEEFNRVKTQDREVSSRTYNMIKPGFTQHRNMIVAKLAKAGLRVTSAATTKMDENRARKFYAEHEGKPFVDSLVDYMTSGDVIAMQVEGVDAVKKTRKVIGATNFEQAEEQTIRKVLAKSVQQNAIHGSDSDKSAHRELEIFGEDLDIKPQASTSLDSLERDGTQRQK